MSLLYQEKKDYKNACLCLTEALAIVKQYPEAVMEEAATHINMAASLMELDELEQAHVHLQEACFVNTEPMITITVLFSTLGGIFTPAAAIAKRRCFSTIRLEKKWKLTWGKQKTMPLSVTKWPMPLSCLVMRNAQPA